MNKEAPAIELTGVNKEFEGQNVLKDVNCSFYQGKTYFLFGSHGSGKSTLLRMMMREICPDSGQIKVFGDNIALYNRWQTALYRREIGVIWQDIKLIPSKTVFENLALPLILKGRKKIFIKERINEFLARTGLFEIKQKYPPDLSFGMRQKIAVIRALISEPKIIIADEPDAYLDTDSRFEIWNWMNEYRSNSLFENSERSGKFTSSNENGIIKPQDSRMSALSAGLSVIIWATGKKDVIDNFSGEVIHLEKMAEVSI